MDIRKPVRLFFLCLLLVSFAGSLAPAEKKLFQMKDVFGLVYAADPQISPDP